MRDLICCNMNYVRIHGFTGELFLWSSEITVNPLKSQLNMFDVNVNNAKGSNCVLTE